MILTCPQCASRFLLPATALVPEGRNVKCSNCGEIWHEVPDVRELREIREAEEEQAFEDIPESVKPIPEGSSVPAVQEEEKEQKPLNDRLIGIAVGGFVSFALILILLLALNKPILNAFPASNGFYKIFGMGLSVPSEGLVFDKLHAGAESGMITLEGTIINLTSEEQRVPMIEAVIKDKLGQDLEIWVIDPPFEVIGREAVEPFSVQITPEHQGGQDINLRFVVKAPKGAMHAGVKTDAAGGGNTHALPLDGPAH